MTDQRCASELALGTTLGELAASLAQELNQPLGAIVANGAGALRWLDRERPNIDEAVQALRRIIREANHAADVIAHARTFLESCGERTQIDLRDTIRQVLVTVEPEMTRHRIAAVQAFAHDLPPVMGSRVELQQVVLNLVRNAIEAMTGVSDRGRELVIRSLRRELNGGVAVAVAVQDSGVGLSQEARARLFEAFYTTKANGLGMGLAISRSIVEAHGGVMWADANSGHGSTFQFVLPACAL